MGFCGVVMVVAALLSAKKSGLVVATRARGVVDPVKNDEHQAADHEDDSNDQEDGCPNLLWGAERQRLYQAEVKSSG